MMFQCLDIYRAIIVTGPQRSGTTIAARIIASETGHEYVDEDDFGVHDFDAARRILLGRTRIVMQCPALAHRVHELAQIDNVLVVWMVRNLNDIYASQERIGWLGEAAELEKYMAIVPRWASEPGARAAEVKRRYWGHTQRYLCRHWKELNYELLEYHPWWIPAERRKLFAPRQWWTR